MLLALDFGRVYLGYINLQNAARIAANFASANPNTNWADADLAAPTTADGRAYRNLILGDTAATNCILPVVAGVTQVPTPLFSDRTGNSTTKDLGDAAAVSIELQLPTHNSNAPEHRRRW